MCNLGRSTSTLDLRLYFQHWKAPLTSHPVTSTISFGALFAELWATVTSCAARCSRYYHLVGAIFDVAATSSSYGRPFLLRSYFYESAATCQMKLKDKYSSFSRLLHGVLKMAHPIGQIRHCYHVHYSCPRDRRLSTCPVKKHISNSKNRYSNVASYNSVSLRSIIDLP